MQAVRRRTPNRDSYGAAPSSDPTKEHQCDRQQRQQRQRQALFQDFGYCLAAAVPFTLVPLQSAVSLFTNRVFMVGLTAWALAQLSKIFTHRFKKGVWMWRACLESGGMPSSHSSLTVGVTTAVALQLGLNSPLFAVSMCYSSCVMYDATGIRRHAGKQAEALNQVIAVLGEQRPMEPIKLKEVLGHTPRQVAVGALLGILVGFLFPGGPLF